MIRARIASGVLAALLAGGTAFAAPVPTSQVQFNPVGLASGYSVEAVAATPYDNSMPPGPVGLPAHTIVNLQGSEPILIIPIADYRDQWTAAGDQTVATNAPRITAISRHESPVPSNNLPLLPPAPAYNDLVALSKPVNFNGGTGFRAVVRYAQDPSPVQSYQLHYRYQGVTVDGNYLVSFDLPLMVNWTEEIAIEDAPAVIGSKASTDFTPTLDQIDAALSTLNIIAATVPTVPAVTNPSPQSPSSTGSNTLNLEGPVWQWTRSTMGGSTLVTVSDPTRYTMHFREDGRVSLRADCNLGSAQYASTGTRFELGEIVTTRIACGEQSLDSEFLSLIANTGGYRIEGRELIVHVGIGLRVIEMHFSPAS